MALQHESEVEQARADAAALANGHRPGNVSGRSPRTVAFVEHGRWIARCPVCPSARWVHPDRPYWCSDCGTTAVVVWPDNDTVTDVDDVLGVRPLPNRNWSPSVPVAGRPGVVGERVVEELCVENWERGYPVPERLRARTEQFLTDDWQARGLADEMARFNAERVHRLQWEEARRVVNRRAG